MQLDNRAYEFMKLAKQNGLSKEEAFAFLQNKGYDLGLQQTAQQVQPTDKYSALDKAKYTTRAGIEGATLGLGDIVAGGTNVLASDLAQLTHGQNLGDRFQAAGRLLSTLNPINAPISAIQSLRRPEFKEGRSEFVEEQKDFSKSHPFLNIGGELVGGVLTGGLGGGGKAIASQAGKQGIKALAKEGARQGAIYGGLYGAGSGLTEDAEKLSAGNALKGGVGGAVGGAVLGAALPAAAVGGTRAAQAFLGTRGYAQRAANEIIQEAGGKEIGQIVRSDKGIRALKAAIKSDDNVARVVREKADNQIINSAEKTKDIINKTLGVDDIVNARNEARALYDNAVNQSTKQLPGDIYNNKATQEALSKAIAEDYSGELASKGPNSLAVAQRAKEKLDDMIAASYEVGNYGVQKATSKTRDLMKVRNAFVKKIDELAPEYKLAREQFAKSIKPYEILEGLTQESGRERANTIKSILTNENKKAITDVFGKEKANQLFSELRAQSIENDRFNKLYNAAESKLTKEQPQTQGLIREALESAGSIVGNAVDLARFGGARRGRRQIGEILLGIEKERNYPSISKIISNKIKEEGGYAMKPLDDTQIAYHGSPVKGIKQLDTAYIGKGEGNQAHGWGTYVAKNKVTGEGYRERLSGKRYNPDNDFDVAQYYFARNRYDRKKALKQLAEDINAGGEVASKNGAYKILQTATDHELANTGGQLYEVKIPKNDVLLDEQKTFGEQPKKVQEALRNIADRLENETQTSVLTDAINENTTGKQIYDLLSKYVERQNGIDASYDPQEVVSKTLNQYGIKGITYDGRQDGRSFVIFNPMKDTKINRTFYSVLAALASAGLLNKQEGK